MSFRDNVARRCEILIVHKKEDFADICAEVQRSVVLGSEITNSEGQPIADVKGGNLRDSWIGEFVAENIFELTTSAPYAESNEDGIARPGGGPYELRAHTGGRHSLALTKAGFGAIKAHVAAKRSAQ